MRIRPFLVLALLSSLWIGPAAAEQYLLDPAHSSVEFSVQHLVLTPVKGDFTQFSGEIFYDEAAAAKSWVKIIIKADSINTNEPDRDKHLKSKDFLFTKKYPEIVFESRRIDKMEGGYLCLGTLSLHGVSKQIGIPFVITGTIKDPQGKTRLGLEGALTLDRRDYGIVWNKVMEGGGLVVGNEVKIALSVEAILQ